LRTGIVCRISVWGELHKRPTPHRISRMVISVDGEELKGLFCLKTSRLEKPRDIAPLFAALRRGTTEFACDPKMR